MPIAYLIHGFVAVGKTTFSKKLEQETGAIRFSHDDWMITLYGSNPPAELFNEYHSRVSMLIWDTAEKALRAKTDVILDCGFWSKSSREEARQRIKATGADCKMYALTCPDDVSMQRALKRTEEMPEGAFFIDKNALEQFKFRFEAADPAFEDFIHIET